MCIHLVNDFYTNIWQFTVCLTTKLCYRTFNMTLSLTSTRQLFGNFVAAILETFHEFDYDNEIHEKSFKVAKKLPSGCQALYPLAKNITFRHESLQSILTGVRSYKAGQASTVSRGSILWFVKKSLLTSSALWTLSLHTKMFVGGCFMCILAHMLYSRSHLKGIF